MDMEYVLDRPEASTLRTNQVQQAGAGVVQGPQQTAQHTPPQQQLQQPQPSRCPYFRAAHQHHGQHHHQTQNHVSNLPLPPLHHPQFSHSQLIPPANHPRSQSQAQIPVVGFLPQSPNHNISPPHQPIAHYHYHYDPASNFWYPAIHWPPGLPLHPPPFPHHTTSSSEAYFASSSENPGPRQGLFGTGSGSGPGSGAVASASGVAGLGLLQSQPPPVLHHTHPNTFPPLLLSRPPDGAFAPVLFAGPTPGALPFPGATQLMPSQNHHQVNHAANANNNQSSANPALSYSSVHQIGVTYSANMSSSGGLGPRFTNGRWSVHSDQGGRENRNGAPLTNETTSPSPTLFPGGSPPPAAASGRPEQDELMPRPIAQPIAQVQPLWEAALMTRPAPRQESAESDEYMTDAGSDPPQPDEPTTAPRAATAESGESMAAPRLDSSDQFGRLSSETWGSVPIAQTSRLQPVPMARSDSSGSDGYEGMFGERSRPGAVQQPAPLALSNPSHPAAQYRRSFGRLPPEIRGPVAIAQEPRPQAVTRAGSGSSELEDDGMPVPASRPDSSGRFGRLAPDPWGSIIPLTRPDPPELPAPSTRPDPSGQSGRRLPAELWGPESIAHTGRSVEVPGPRPAAYAGRHDVHPSVQSDYDSDEDPDQLEDDDRDLRFIDQFSVNGDFPRDMGEAQVRAHQILRGQAPSKRVASRRAVSQLQEVDIDSLEESERTCVICYNEYGVKNPEGAIEGPLRLPRCKHIFGANCIRKWLTQSDTCPYCRDKLPSEPAMPPSAQYIREMYSQHMGPRPPSSRRTLNYNMPLSVSDVNIRIMPHIGDDTRVDNGPPRGSQTGERRSPPAEASESRRRTRPRHSSFRASPSAAGSNANRQSLSDIVSSVSTAPAQQGPLFRDRVNDPTREPVRFTIPKRRRSLTPTRELQFSRQRPYSHNHPSRRPSNMPLYRSAEPHGQQGPRPLGMSYMSNSSAREPQQLNQQNESNEESQQRLQLNLQYTMNHLQDPLNLQRTMNHLNQLHQQRQLNQDQQQEENQTNRQTSFGVARGPRSDPPATLPGPSAGPPTEFPNPPWSR